MTANYFYVLQKFSCIVNVNSRICFGYVCGCIYVHICRSQEIGNDGSKYALNLSTQCLSVKTCGILAKLLSTFNAFVDIKFNDCCLPDEGIANNEIVELIAYFCLYRPYCVWLMCTFYVWLLIDVMSLKVDEYIQFIRELYFKNDLYVYKVRRHSNCLPFFAIIRCGSRFFHAYIFMKLL